MTERHRLASNKCNLLKLAFKPPQFYCTDSIIYGIFYIEVLEPVGCFWQTLLGLGELGMVTNPLTQSTFHPQVPSNNFLSWFSQTGFSDEEWDFALGDLLPCLTGDLGLWDF